MFSAGEDTRAAKTVVECPRLGDDLRHIPAVAAPAQRVVSLVVVGDVEHRAEIEVEPEHPQQAASDVAVLPDQIQVIAIPQLLGVWRLVADELQPRDPPAFLVDCDDRLDVGNVAQIIDQLPQLRRFPDVSAEKNIPAGLDFLEKACRFGIEFRSRHADEDELARIVDWHEARNH